MPVRAFLDSDAYAREWSFYNVDAFQCPSGHFLIQTYLLADVVHLALEFQCPSGHFLIQTKCGSLWRRDDSLPVSMPVRAFLDSDSYPKFHGNL